MAAGRFVRFAVKIELNLSVPKATPRVRKSVVVVMLAMLAFSIFGIWADFPWNGNPVAWLSAKEAYIDGTGERSRFALTDACNHFQKAVNIYPRDPQFQFALGETLERLTKLPEAADHFRQAVAIRPNFVAAWLHLSTVQAMLGQIDESIKSAGQAVHFEPRNAEATCQLALLTAETGKADEAARLFASTRQMDTSAARYHFLSGQYYQMIGKKKEAENELHKAAMLDHDEPEYAEWLGMLLLDQGRTSEAKEWLYRATTVDGRCPQYWENLAALNMKLNDFDQAAIDLEKAHLLAPDNFLYAKRFAMCLFDAKHYKLADEALTELVVNKKSTDPDLWVYFCNCLAQIKTYGEAEKILIKLAKNCDPSVKARTLQYLGTLYDLQGKVEMAEQTYKEALNSNPPPGIRDQLNERLASGVTPAKVH